jgi:hypothetical protein
MREKQLFDCHVCICQMNAFSLLLILFRRVSLLSMTAYAVLARPLVSVTT